MGNCKPGHSMRIDIVLDFTYTPGVHLVKTGSSIQPKLDTQYWSTQLGDMKAAKLTNLPRTANAYVPIQLTNQGSFKVGSRPTFDLLPAPSLRFMPA